MATQTRTANTNRTARVQQFIRRQIGSTTRQVKTTDLITACVQIVLFTLVFFLAVAVVDAWVWPLSTASRLLALIVWIGGTVYLVATRLVPLLIRRVNPLFAARMIEQAKPEFKNSLVNCLELEKSGDGIPRPILEAVSYQAATHLDSVKDQQLVDRSPLIRVGFLLVAVVALFIAYGLFSPKNPLQTIGRVLAPFADLARPASVRISEIEPGDAEVFFGERLDVTARIRGLKGDQAAHLVYSTDDGGQVEVSIPLEPSELDPNVYSAQLTTGPAGIESSLHYSLIAGDGTSARYRVTVRPAPVISVNRIEVVPPEYTRLPPRTIEGQGEIQGIEGSQVTVHAIANAPIDVAFIELLRKNNGPRATDEYQVIRTVEMQSEDRTAVGNFVLALNSGRSESRYTHYQVRFKTEAGVRDLKPNVYPIRTVADLAPEVKFLQPVQTELSVPVNHPLTLQVQASDLDFELSEIALVMDHVATEVLDQKIIVADAQSMADTPSQPGRPVVAKQTITPEQFSWKPGDEVLLFATAADNRISPFSGQPDPNVSRTPNIKLKITGPSEQPEPPPSAEDKTQQNPDQPGAAPDDADRDPDSQPDNPNDGSDTRNDSDHDDSDRTNDQSDDRSSQSSADEGPDPADTDSSMQPDERTPDSGNPDDSNNPESSNDSTDSSPDGSEADSADSSGDSQTDSGDGSQTDSNGESGDGSSDSNQAGNASSNNGASQPSDAAQAGSAENANPSDSSRPGSNNQGNSSNENPNGGNADATGEPGGQPGSSNDNGTNPQAAQDSALRDGQVEALPEDASDGEKFEQLEKLLSQNDSSNDGDPGDNSDSNDNRGNNNNDDAASGNSNPGDQANDTDASAGDQSASDSGAAGSQNSRPENAGDQGSSASSKPDTGEPGEGSSDNRNDAESDSSMKRNPDDTSSNQANEQNQQSGNGNGDASSESNQSGYRPGQSDSNSNSSNSSSSGNQPASGSEGSQGSNSSDSQSGDSQSGDSQSGDSQSGDSQPGDSQSGDAQPGSSQSDSSGSQDSATGAEPQSNSNGDSEAPSDRGDQPDSGNGNSNQGNESGSDNQSADSGDSGSQSGNQNSPNGEGQSNQDSGQSPSSSQGGSDSQSKSGSSPQGQSQSGSGGQQPSGSKSPGQSDASSSSPNSPAGSAPSSGNASSSGPTSQSGGGSAKSDMQLGTDDPDLEHAKKATDLILKRLKDQETNPDPELLEKMNWTQEDLKRFLQRWEEMKRRAMRGDQQAKREYENALRSLGLAPAARRRDLQTKRDAMHGLSEDGAVNRPPPEVMEKFNAFLKSRNRVRDRD